MLLGAGLAGLSASYNLARSGFEVVVLEAQDRPGGRVQTVRAPFVNGGYGEMGALRIPDVHRYTNKYIDEFRLKSKLFEYNEPGEQLWCLDGQRFTTPRSGRDWPLKKMSAEERRDPSAMVASYFGPALAAVGDIHAANWPNVGQDTIALDRFTVAAFLQKNGATDAWIRFLGATEGNLGRFNNRCRRVTRFLPGLDCQVVASYVKVWREDPFAAGAFAFAQPGQLHWIFPTARRPDNRLHFAGEHTSVSPGWMDGALESGERVAAEITERARTLRR